MLDLRILLRVVFLSSALYEFVCLVVFQAEDGIRYLVRSRGLGDVYNRQVWYRAKSIDDPGTVFFDPNKLRADGTAALNGSNSVSYTHLTLPTSDLV